MGLGAEAKSVKIPQEQLSHEGSYSVVIKLLDGWNHTASLNQPCKLPQTTFAVSCAPRFIPSTISRACEHQDFMQVCKGAVVQAGGETLSKSGDSVQIADTKKLTVSFDNTSNLGSFAQVQLLPLGGGFRCTVIAQQPLLSQGHWEVHRAPSR